MKIARKTILRYGLMISILSVLIIACKKNTSFTNNPSGSRNVAVYLTDDPCQYDSVFIDVKYIELKIDTSIHGNNENQSGDNNENQSDDRNDNSWKHDGDHDEDHQHSDKNGIWDTLNIKPGLYNILQLRNGNDVIIGTGNIPAGNINKMRLTVGSRSYVVVSGVKHSLNLFHSQDNFSYINVHGEDEDDNFNPGQTSMWIDFNICKSIKLMDDQYYLKPFISIFAMSNTGSVEGNVFPHSAQPFVTVWNTTDTASALPEENGRFKIRGLNAGVYNVTYNGSFGYKDTTITNIQVQKGKETQLPNITLHQ